MSVRATAPGLTHGFDDYIRQTEAEDAEDGVQDPEEYGVVGQKPGDVLGQHAVDGFTVTDHGSPVVVRCSNVSIHSPCRRRATPFRRTGTGWIVLSLKVGLSRRKAEHEASDHKEISDSTLRPCSRLLPESASECLFCCVHRALRPVKFSARCSQGNRMKIAFCRNNACKDSGRKGAGFPPARERRSEYSVTGQQNIHSIALAVFR
jgi:hypothetical protein